MDSHDDSVWVGAFAAGIASIVVALERSGMNAKLAHSELRGLLESYMRSPACSQELLDALGRSLKDAWVVEAANGEVFAVRDDREDAEAAVRQAELYLGGALVHPSANRFVADRMPIVARPISRVQRSLLLEDGTPLLDREP